MSFLSLLRSFFDEKPPNTGCLFDLSDSGFQSLPDHDIYGSSPGAKPAKDWTSYCPPYRWQGSSMMCTAYAGTAIASIFNKAETGEDVLFSPLELFVRSGGQLYGNYVTKTAEALKQSVVADSAVPTPYVDRWDQAFLNSLELKAQAPKTALEQGKKYAIKSMARVGTSQSELKAALQDSPVSVIVNVGRGYFNTPVVPASAGYSGPLHNVVLVAIEPDGRKKIFDSLTDRNAFNGFRYLAPDFPFLSAFSYIDLPNNWQQDFTPAPTYFLADLNGRIIPFRSKEAVDYQMFVKAGYKPLN
jgi:hypothetical protein